MLHITDGDAARVLLERSGVPGVFVPWPDVLHEGPTALVSGDEWIRIRSRYLAGSDDDAFDEILREYRAHDAALEAYADHEEVVFWFEHDLFDQLLLSGHASWRWGI